MKTRDGRDGLNEYERSILGRVNIWVMDWICDGGVLPPEVCEADRRQHAGIATAADLRVVIAWAEWTAPGTYLSI